MRSALYVGRVGALAVALGIGAAPVSMAGTACATPDGAGSVSAESGGAAGGSSTADPGSTNAQSSTDTSSVAHTIPTNTDPITDADPNNSDIGEPSDTLDPTPDGQDPAVDQNPDAAAPQAVDTSTAQPGTDTGASDDTPVADEMTPSLPATPPPVSAMDRSHPNPRSFSVDLPTAATDPEGSSDASDASDPPTRDTQTSDPVSTPQPPQPKSEVANTDAVPQVFSAPAIPDAPAGPSTVSSTLTAVVSDLLGSGGTDNGPVESPVSWLMLAAARRELGNTEPGTFSVATPAPTAQPLDAPNTAPTARLAYLTGPSWFTGKVYGDVRATDTDHDRLTYTVDTPPAKGTVTINRWGTFTFTPTAAARHAAAATTAGLTDKTQTFTITVGDPKGGTATVEVTVAIKPADTAPRARLAALTHPDPTTGVVTGQVTATDRDGDAITYSAPANTGKGTLNVNPDGTFTYTPTAAARRAATGFWGFLNNSDTLRITASDGHGKTATTAVRVRIAPQAATTTPNTAPEIANTTVNTPDENGNVTGSVTATDADHDTLAYTATTPVKGSVSLDSATGEFSYTPTDDARHAAAADTAPDTDKHDAFTVTASDGRGGTLPIAVTVDISPTNTAPEITNATVNDPDTDGAVTGSVTAADADHDTLAYNTTTTPAKGSVTVDSATGEFTYTPTGQARQDAADTPGEDTDTFTITASDRHGGTLPIAVTVPIRPNTTPNTAPGNGSATVNPPDGLGNVTGSVTATDADHDTLAYNTTTTPAKGSVTVDSATGEYTYTPTDDARHAAAADTAPDTDKHDAFTVTASDGRGGTLPIAVTVDISPANANPDITNALSGVPKAGGVVTGTVKASDADDDTLTYSGTGSTPQGSVVVNAGGTFTYTPDASARQSANGSNVVTDSFTVTVTDGHGGTTSQDITVTVAPTGSVGVPGQPTGPIIAGRNGYTYQTVTDNGQSRVIIMAPNGTSTVSQPMPGVAATAGAYQAVPRADGSITVYSLEVDNTTGTPSPADITARLVNVDIDGTTTTAYTGAVGVPLWSGEGTAYLLTPTTKTVTGVGEQDSFEVVRVGSDGVATTFSYDTGDSQFAGDAQTPAIGADGTLYVPFTNWSGTGVGGPLAHAAVLAIPTSGAAAVIPITALTGTANADLGRSLVAKSSADGTVFVLATGFDTNYVLTIAPGGSTSRQSLPAGTPMEMEVGGRYAVVAWQGPAADPDADPIGHLSFINRGLVDTQPWSGGPFTVGPDGTVYSPGDSEGSTLRMTIPTGSVTRSLDGYLDATHDMDSLIKFSSEGTAFAQVSKDDGSTHIEIPSIGVSSASVSGGSDDPVSFQVVNDIAIMIAGGADGIHVVAIDTDGNSVAEKTFSAEDGTGVMGSVPVAVGPDGAVYVALTKGGPDDPVTTVWAVSGDTADAVCSDAGVAVPTPTGGGGFNVTDDLHVNLTLVRYEMVGGSTVVTTNVATEPLGVSVPQTSVTKQVNRATGVVTGTLTVDPAFGNGIQFGGSTAGPLGQVVVNSDGSWVFTPSAAARDFAEQSGKVNNVVFGITVTNSDGGQYTVPVNVSLLSTNYPATPSDQSRPLHWFYGPTDSPGSLAWLSSADGYLGYWSGGSGSFSREILTATTLHAWTTNGTDVVTAPPGTCSGSSNCGEWNKYERTLSYTSAPDLVTGPYNDIPAVPDVYVISKLHMTGYPYYNDTVLGYQKLSLGDTVYIKEDEGNSARVDQGTGIVKQSYVTYDAVAFAPGTFPEDWFYTRIPGVVGGFIFNNELPEDAMVDTQQQEYDEGRAEYIHDRQNHVTAIHNAGHTLKWLLGVAVDPIASVFGAGLHAVKLAVTGAIEFVQNKDQIDAQFNSQPNSMLLSQGPTVSPSPQIGL